MRRNEGSEKTAASALKPAMRPASVPLRSAKLFVHNRFEDQVALELDSEIVQRLQDKEVRRHACLHIVGASTIKTVPFNLGPEGIVGPGNAADGDRIDMARKERGTCRLLDPCVARRDSDGPCSPARARTRDDQGRRGPRPGGKVRAPSRYGKVRLPGRTGRQARLLPAGYSRKGS